MQSPSEKWVIEHPERIQLYSFATPNGVKVSTALEELELPYEAHLVNILKGDQTDPGYIKISPNSKIPVIVDPDGPDGKPLALMESGAILLHLAQKAGRLLPEDARERSAAIQWLFFQVGHAGPMFGQLGHFAKFAGDKCDHPYPKERYRAESERLLGVLDSRLQKAEYLAGSEYSIADIATFPWVVVLEEFYGVGGEVKLDQFDAVQRWLSACTERPGYQRGRLVCRPG